MNDIKGSAMDYSGSGPVEYRPADAAPQGTVERLLARHGARLLDVPGVTSVGIGSGPAGGEALMVGVVDAGIKAHLPAAIEGVPVVVTVTGEVDALPQR